MSYRDLLNDPILYLPVSQNGDGFRSSIRLILEQFLQEVGELGDESMGIVGLEYITGDYVKRVQKVFINGLLSAIDTYYDGRPADAFRKLSETLDNELKDFREILKIRSYEAGESFFRMRTQRGNFPLDAKNMFHIPFEKRGLVKTQRYSIPGFPCLYLGRTLYGCWEEMNRPDINEFQVVRLKNTLPIRFLDLTRPVYGDNLFTRDIYHYFMTWPLIACCSVKVSRYEEPYKPEYIVSQLLLQWVRQNAEIEAIKFNSTHIDFHHTKSEGDFSNLVLPVKENKDQGFCSLLTSKFEMTTSISWQLHQHALGGGTFVGSFNDDSPISRRIVSLELIKDRALPYRYSVLGNLESYLDGMPTLPLNGLDVVS